MTNGKAMTNEQQRQLLRILAAKKDTVRTVCDPDGCLARYSVKSTPIGEVFFDDGDNHLWTYKYRPNNRFPYAVKLDERQLARFNDWLLDECRAELLELLNKLPENNKGEDKKKKTIPEMIKELKKADYMGIDEVVVDYLDVEDEQGNTHTSHLTRCPSTISPPQLDACCYITTFPLLSSLIYSLSQLLLQFLNCLLPLQKVLLELCSYLLTRLQQLPKLLNLLLICGLFLL